MKFSVDQHYDAPAADVFELFADPTTQTSLPEFGRISRAEPLSDVTEGDLRIVRMRFRFTADLPTAALAIIDPAKLTWVEETTFDRSQLSARTRFVPDHYGSKLAASAAADFRDAADDGSVRHIRGEFRVRILFGAGPVERAIVSGLREHLDEEAVHVAGLLAAR